MIKYESLTGVPLIGENDQLHNPRDSYFRCVTAHTISSAYKPPEPPEPPEPCVVCPPGPPDVGLGGLEPPGVVEPPGMGEVLE